MNILGISAFYHDSAACLVVDGLIVAAAQEERFTRKKHDADFPTHAVEYCLKAAGLTPGQLSYVAFYEKPLRKFDRLLETYFAFAPQGLRSFAKALPQWVGKKLQIPREIRRRLSGYTGPIVFPEHHESHAASAFFPSPYDHAAILTLDGVGEWSTSTIGFGKGNKIHLSHELRFPHSLGLLYSAFTYFAGFRVNSGEYKLMGLAPYGTPRFAPLIREKLIDLKEDGSFRMDLSYFQYCQGLTMTSPRMDELFGGPPRSPESKLTQREMDIAASIQAVTEEVMLRTAKHLRNETGAKYLTMAGGVSLNCVGNGRILREAGFEDLWIQPASGDAGGALGAALFVWHQLCDRERVADDRRDRQDGSFLGPRFTRDEVTEALDSAGAHYRWYTDEVELVDKIARLIADEKVIGLVQGRMEFGPRALGGRSIVGDARSRRMQSTMNLKIKFRESFRPFAPAVLHDKAHEWFDVRPGQQSPYMLLVAPVQDAKRLATAPEDDNLHGMDLLKVPRSEVPAVTHVDFSARVQTVDERHGLFHRILVRFHELTGCPVVINTSFNIRGEPIVCSPSDAYRCFLATDMDVLVVENAILVKSDQDAKMSQLAVDDYKSKFELD